MSEDINNTIIQLRQISAIDAKLARVKAEQKKLSAELNKKKEVLEQLNILSSKTALSHQQQDAAYKKEERGLKAEQDKLVDRRKALHSLQNYKLQQAAEKEIEAASRQLESQEEKLIGQLDVIEDLLKKSKDAQAELEQATSDLKKFSQEYEVSLKTFQELTETYLNERKAAVANISAASLQFYERVAERYPFDAIVPYKELACGGCYLGLGPQVMQEIGRAKGLVRCRGCGRILFLENAH